jgi:hypothetical protein
MRGTVEQFVLTSGKACQLIRIRNDLIPNYFLLTFPKSAGEPCPAELSEMMAFGMSRAQELAFERTGDRGAFSLLYGGYSARREAGWHVHIVLLGNRWKKAWLYVVLAGKNLLQGFGLRKDDAPRVRL